MSPSAPGEDVQGDDDRETTGFDELLPQPDAEEEAAAAGSMSRVSGWRRVFRGNRTLWIVASVAVLSLVGGLLIGRFVVSPADAAANAQAPEAGLITVPVELGELSNDVTIRGDVGYADAVEVTIDAADIGGAAVVTGQVPEAGAVFGPLAVALEVVGRPVIVLPGELPAYRTLRVGVSGPDVLQFKQAMAAVGINAGDVNSNVFDAAAAGAVGALYDAVGYPAPAPVEGSADAVRAAEEGVRSADQAIQAARAELNRASGGASPVEIREADNAISSAQRQLATAQAQVPADPNQIADMQDAVGLAILRREQLSRPPDTSAQQAALDSARAQRDAAAEGLQRAREEGLSYLPASEVLYLTQLPRRVDNVTVKRGAILSGAAMTVSGADVQVTASAAEADASLLAVGAEATFELPDGTPHRAVVARIDPPGTGSGEGGEAPSSRWSLTLQPDPLTPEQISALQGQNVRVTIPVGATQGEVLSVPLAALTAGPGGESRVEIVVGDPEDGKDAETRLVVVETGLAAAGYVEVAPVDDELAQGDLVVVGQ
ncbi:MAG TPA: hypothetical protein VFY91_13350 [Microbacterium sp.]|nr:hypothetical protein [Microbacterium sp.]